MDLLFELLGASLMLASGTLYLRATLTVRNDNEDKLLWYLFLVPACATLILAILFLGVVFLA